MATDYTAQDEAWGKQYDEQQAADKQQTEAAKQPQSFLQKFTGAVGRVTSSMIDGAVATAEDPELGAPMRAARDVAAGAVTGAANIADAGVSAAKTALPMVAPVTPEQVAAASPIWDHAKQHILDFRDAIAVHDPTLSDSLLQGVAQLAIPFTGYSRALGMLHGAANTVAAGMLTDATALAPHDMRTADLIALGQHAEGKLGDALRAAGPYGLNAYVNYLADRTNETEAQGRFKNVLDGLGINAVAIPLLHAAGVTLKQGQIGLRHLAENGVRNTLSDMVAPAPLPGSLEAQRGSVGQMLDGAEDSPLVKELRAQYQKLAKVPLDYRTKVQSKQMSTLLDRISDMYGHENAMRHGQTLGEVRDHLNELEKNPPEETP